ncbi:hypothetical protein C3941_19470 [Kaistia algarum]|uniref:helix-turn-helix domain-containing protein n=1 Tax=Kaistia algarum TaxID=2083279 RepID=UPI000CE777D5|nr:helix-turn-helix domain-containing protein [Kaistia algarum]MCX5516172.1 helix-turn-helix domain-containing protein [Kaistia algarum]PPE78247.1 hypothetical protein C3941_19470 [Kaistia algarum]
MTAVERMPERIRADAVAAILGIEVRTVQALAARGELPGAMKIGRLWTFDESALRLWIRERTTCLNDRRHQSTHTGAKTRYGRDLPLQAEKSARAYEQTLQRLRQGGSPK